MRLKLITILVIFQVIYSNTLIGRNADTLIFPTKYANDSTFDCSGYLNEMISKSKKYTLISFVQGDYYFKNTVTLKSNISIAGKKEDTVKFIFNLAGKGDLIHVKGSIRKTSYNIIDNVEAGAFEVKSDAKELKAGMLLRVYKSNPGRVLSTWAKGCIGQLLEVSEVKDSTIQFKTKIKLPYSSNEKSKLEIIQPIENVKLANLIIERKDETTHQTSNIVFSYARNCNLENVFSVMANFAHVSIDYAMNISLEKVDMFNSFSHGNGGRGYGVALQYSSTDCLVQNCVFRKLRHGVVLQSGANGNLVSGNYALEGFWEGVRLPKFSAGDFVLHGNYPYQNFIVGNVCNQIVVDKSHGLNGYNVLKNNRTLKYGIFVQRKSTEGVLIQQNDIVKVKFLEGKIRGRKKELELVSNRRNDKSYKGKSDARLRCVTIKKDLNQIYKIGHPCDFKNFYNAAFFRYSTSLISFSN